MRQVDCCIDKEEIIDMDILQDSSDESSDDHVDIIVDQTGKKSVKKMFFSIVQEADMEQENSTIKVEKCPYKSH